MSSKKVPIACIYRHAFGRIDSGSCSKLLPHPDAAGRYFVMVDESYAFNLRDVNPPWSSGPHQHTTQRTKTAIDSAMHRNSKRISICAPKPRCLLYPIMFCTSRVEGSHASGSRRTSGVCRVGERLQRRMMKEVCRLLPPECYCGVAGSSIRVCVTAPDFLGQV